MRRGITRRDFLNGVAITVGAAILPFDLLAAAAVPDEPEKSLDYYPPALTGLRGSHPGSFDAAHSLRDGNFWDHAGTPVDTREHYDLVIVGGGISGLSAAHFFRKSAGPRARILILDNHDDFGGHAKRNEFHSGQRTMLGFGGTFSIESPAPYSAVAKGLIEELGIDVPPIEGMSRKTCTARSAWARRFFWTRRRSARTHSPPIPCRTLGERARTTAPAPTRWSCS